MKREYSIYRTLKQLARQRVALILQPGNVWVLEQALPETEENQENLQTCLMRGWIEVLHDAVPSGALQPDGSLPVSRLFEDSKPLYRLTDAGWNAVHRAHVMAFLGILASLLGVLITVLQN